jgi:hypothetical protein
VAAEGRANPVALQALRVGPKQAPVAWMGSDEVALPRTGRVHCRTAKCPKSNRKTSIASRNGREPAGTKVAPCS